MLTDRSADRIDEETLAMERSGDGCVPPDVALLLRALIDHGAGFLLVGSVAVEAWGADVGTPGDLDIVPALDRGNLSRLAAVLAAVEATSWPVTGWWEQEGDEVRWIEYDAGDPRRGQRLPPPNPADIATCDSLFSTIHGELDIVPRISGTFDDLRARATALTVHGVGQVPVMSIADLLARLTAPRRKKVIARVEMLRARQRELHSVDDPGSR
jgi:hypothetical protein